MTPTLKELFAALDALGKFDASINHTRLKASLLRFIQSDPTLRAPSLRATWLDHGPGGFAVWMSRGGRTLYCRAEWQKGASAEWRWKLPPELRPMIIKRRGGERDGR